MCIINNSNYFFIWLKSCNQIFLLHRSGCLISAKHFVYLLPRQTAAPYTAKRLYALKALSTCNALLYHLSIIQARQGIFNNLSFEISHCFKAVEIFFCFCILQHYCTTFIICITYCKCMMMAKNQKMVFLLLYIHQMFYDNQDDRV